MWVPGVLLKFVLDCGRFVWWVLSFRGLMVSGFVLVLVDGCSIDLVFCLRVFLGLVCRELWCDLCISELFFWVLGLWFMGVVIVILGCYDRFVVTLVL